MKYITSQPERLPLKMNLAAVVLSERHVLDESFYFLRSKKRNNFNSRARHDSKHHFSHHLFQNSKRKKKSRERWIKRDSIYIYIYTQCRWHRYLCSSFVKFVSIIFHCFTFVYKAIHNSPRWRVSTIARKIRLFIRVGEVSGSLIVDDI